MQVRSYIWYLKHVFKNAIGPISAHRTLEARARQYLLVVAMGSRA